MSDVLRPCQISETHYTKCPECFSFFQKFSMEALETANDLHIEIARLKAERDMLVEALEVSLGVWVPIHANLRNGARLDIDTICHVMENLSSIIAKVKKEEA